MKAGIISLVIGILFTLVTPNAFAAEVSHPSATFADINALQKKDTRAIVLKKYLEKHNSPMASYAEVFVLQADINHIPWHLVAAIAGTESTFGQHEPRIGCNNGWGYGIYGNNVLCFPTYTHAIKTISRSLRENYIDKWGATDVYGIGRFYAASPRWAGNTLFFMREIEEFKLAFETKHLSISL